MSDCAAGAGEIKGRPWRALAPGLATAICLVAAGGPASGQSSGARTGTPGAPAMEDMIESLLPPRLNFPGKRRPAVPTPNAESRTAKVPPIPRRKPRRRIAGISPAPARIAAVPKPPKPPALVPLTRDLYMAPAPARTAAFPKPPNPPALVPLTGELYLAPAPARITAVPNPPNPPALVPLTRRSYVAPSPVLPSAPVSAPVMPPLTQELLARPKLPRPANVPSTAGRPPEPPPRLAQIAVKTVAPRPAALARAVPGSRILFAPGSAKLSQAARDKLTDLAQALVRSPSTRLQLVAYAREQDDDPVQARRSSLSRVIAVRRFLVGKGVASIRMDVRALGDQTSDGPADRVDLVPRPAR